MKRQGFTLIELLLALLIYSVVAVLIAHSLSNLINAYQSNEQHATRLAEIQEAMELLERDIEQIVNRPIVNEIGQIDPAFMMNTDVSQRIEFTRMGYINPFQQYNRSTLLRVAYQFKNNSLIRFNWTDLDRTQSSKSEERIVLSQVERISWQFYDNNNQYTIWPPTATWLYNVPRAIELTLNLKDKGVMKRFFELPDGYGLSISR